MGMLKKSDMHEHQNKVSNFLQKHQNVGAMAWLDVGGGKTVSTLDAIAGMYNQFSFERALIVSTKRVVMHVWGKEIQNWEQTHGMTVTTREQLLAVRRNRTEPDYLEAKRKSEHMAKLIRKKGKKKVPAKRMKEFRHYTRLVRAVEKEEILKLDTHFTMINVENFRWLTNVLGRDWPFDTLIFDESSLFRNSDSKRFNAAKRIRPYTQTVFELTGTPAPNGYIGLWSQVFLIDQGARLGENITDYREKYFEKDYSGFNWIPKDGAEAEIRSLIADIVISLDPRDYMELGPDPIHEEYKLELPPRLRKQYRQLEKEFLLEVEGDTIMALSEAVKSSKLRQFCNGAVYALNKDETENKKKVINIHDMKVDVVKEIVEISNGKPLIVAYEFVSDKKKLLKAFPDAITMKEFNQDDWDNGRIPMLVVHPASGGHGLNLQHGGHAVVWFPTSIDLELYDQLNGRVGELRQAQSGYFIAPIYYHIFFAKTVEEDLIKRRNKKNVTQQTLIKAIRDGVTRRHRA